MIPVINKNFVYENGVTSSKNWVISGKNKTIAYTNANSYAVDAIITMQGGLGERTSNFHHTNYGFTSYNAGAQGVSVHCKVNNALISTALGGMGSKVSERIWGWRSSYRCGFLKSRTCWDTHYNALKQPTSAQAGEIKHFMVTIPARGELKFEFTNTIAGNATASITIMQ